MSNDVNQQAATDKGDRPGIVVGVDGSPGSDHALRWAMAHADRFGPVQPVTTWRYPWWMVPSQVPG
ncbi:MAG: universal stress protein, partial [Acidimicrobiales bacterium]